ncbi:hypothetical protein [Pseudobacillus wudalianchiensis]|uniref:Rad50/SbcC-type AAA domain-containing protein n=1 Tax=Pseudobacillus wudalianchiensis TaxID=1743143 RepID=A0A1B9ANB2_9BACI|nr:hypothetical protein [Bacillus wudalianchiensis]OCA85261.1 hypothetical protein A8F95_11360 [Bacillus wudalianchiensis]
MNRLTLKRLIVISNKEKKSRELTFEEGLNIISGANKTGKSSLIKSIFHTFGCEVRFEPEWKGLIDKFVLFFQYGERDLCILRQQSLYKVFEIKEGILVKLFEDDKFHSYSEKLMNLMEISMVCSTKENIQVSITPPLLFRFQYIDQDDGWNKIGESFTNMKYIKDWKGHTNKYIVGFQGEEFYQAIREREIIKNEMINLSSKMNHFDEFLDKLQGIVNENNNMALIKKLNLQTQKKIADGIIYKIDKLERERIKKEELLSKYKSYRYEKNLEIQFIKKQVQYLNEDHKYAMEEDEIIKCPFCGTDHINSIEERTEIVKDIQAGNKLIQLHRREIEALEEKISVIEKERLELNNDYYKLKLELEKLEESASIIDDFRMQGQLSIIETGNNERDNIKDEYDSKIVDKDEMDREIKRMNSQKRRKEITNQLTGFYETVLNQLNIPTSYIQLRDFVQTLTRLGSDSPRIIYAYHIALYLYNLERLKSPFNILVIDTPNQQGQDRQNLKNIDSVLELLTSEKGQVIIGTERETGFEKEAARWIKLTDYRSCLSEEKFQHHDQLISKLNSIS